MKKNRIFTFALFLLLACTFSAFAVVQEKTVGVPLDGGLLTILGAAGIAYFIIRKKKK